MKPYAYRPGPTRALLITLKILVLFSLTDVVFAIASVFAGEWVLRERLFAFMQAGNGLLMLLVGLVHVVFYCIWTHRAHCNARALGARKLVFGPVTSFIWIFVPFANWVLPFLAMREIVQASDRDSQDTSQLSTWWVMSIIGGLLAGFGVSLSLGSVYNRPFTIIAVIDGLSAVTGIVGSLALMSVVERVARAQQDRSRGLESRALPLPSSRSRSRRASREAKVLIPCPCGAGLKVRRSDLGKKARCRCCGEVVRLLIPAGVSG